MIINMQRRLLQSAFEFINFSNTRYLWNSATLFKVEDRKEMLASMPTKEEGVAGEKSVDVDALLQNKKHIFPDLNSSKQLFNGVMFSEIPVCNVRVSRNNTIISICDAKGTPRMIKSCGTEGFKNTRKGTNIAAQATAISISAKSIELGWKTVRVQVRGLGPGRMSAIKGLQMGGLNVVSITDCTPVSWMPPRPRKQRKL